MADVEAVVFPTNRNIKNKEENYGITIKKSKNIWLTTELTKTSQLTFCFRMTRMVKGLTSRNGMFQVAQPSSSQLDAVDSAADLERKTQ